MSFSSPEWFFIVPALAVLGWRVRSLKLSQPLRVLALLVLVLALADPRMRFGQGGLDIWLLVDRSDSASAASTAQAPEVETILEHSRHGDDRLRIIDFAQDAVRREQGDPVFRGTQKTRIGAALEFTLAQFDPERSNRILVLTDGYATEPLGTAVDKILRRSVALDYRLLAEDTGDDVRVAQVNSPARVLPGEAFLLNFTVAGRRDADVPWEVSRDGRDPVRGVVKVRGGTGQVRLSDRLGGSGSERYTVKLTPASDAHPENNTGEAWVEVAGGPRSVLITNYPDDPLAGFLRSQGLSVQVVTEPNKLTPAALTGARLVIINNVPAHRVASEFLSSLDFFVREQGGGLLMCGGENSFGSGGYFSSAIDALLPVSMELRKEQRKLATALAIVLDRSGSMAASAGGGITKMDLADSGAARAIELLGDLDAVSVHAIDTAPHAVVELAQVGPNRTEMIDSTRRIVSAGGGIYVDVGLHAGWDELKKAKTGQRHLILFADANDAKEPGDYKETLAEMRAAGATVSVIGMGSETDHDADFLKDVAQRGGGRIFFNADPTELPALFAQETVSIARSAFIKEVTPAVGTPGWVEIAARSPQWLSSVDGYNLSYLRPGATASLVTTDEYQAPLVAAWPRGAGRTASVSFPLGGPYSDLVRKWTDYGDFVQTLTRWLAGENVPPGLALRTEVRGEELTLDLLYDDSWAARLAQAGPTATLAESSGGRGPDETRPLIWEKIEPGRFRVTTQLSPGKRVRGVVKLGGTTLPFGPLAVSSAAEWSFDRERLQELRQLSLRSGGQERLDLASIWKSPREVHERPLRPWLLTVWAILLITDAALTRFGIGVGRSVSAWP